MIGLELERLRDLSFLEDAPGGLRFVEPVVRKVLATTAPPRRLARRTGFPDRSPRPAERLTPIGRPTSAGATGRSDRVQLLRSLLHPSGCRQ
jgi:hypothetical protein